MRELLEKLNELRSSQAAEYLKYADNTMRKSRVTGILGGRSAPKYRKIGGRIFYQKGELDAWLELSSLQQNTSQTMEM